MSHWSPLAIVPGALLLATACGGSSGRPEGASPAEVEALRQQLHAAGFGPLTAPPPVPDGLFELGRALFFDKVLSGNEDVSCATCHLPQFFTADGRTLSDGVGGSGFGPSRGGGARIPRNAPSLLNLHLKSGVFWDGRVELGEGFVAIPPAVELTGGMRAALRPELGMLATQAMLPPVSREEMRGREGENPLGDLGDGYNSPGGDPANTGLVWQALTEKLLDLPGYLSLLRTAYPDVPVQDINFAHVGNAIAAFEVRAFARSDSPFERFVRGDDSALTAAQVRGGLEFFGPAGCARCHSGALFSDQQYHNTGLPQLGPGVNQFGFDPFFSSDFGRANVTHRTTDMFLFRTPSLLNVAQTAPYGHAGQFARLRDAVAHYRDAVLSHRQYDIQSNVDDPALVTSLVPNSGLVLTTLDLLLQAPNDFDVDAVVEFLGALTASSAFDLAEVVPSSVPSGNPVF